ncbi:MAG: ATP-binding protein [Bacteroidia bacterium]|nr:ATP-binding protein [Bacteroidia bacterium]
MYIRDIKLPFHIALTCLLVFSLGMVAPIYSFAQTSDSTIDTYFPVWEKVPVNTLGDWLSIRNNSPEILTASKRSIILAESNNNLRQKTYAYLTLGFTYEQVNRFDSAKLTLIKADSLAQKLGEPKLLFGASYALARTYLRLLDNSLQLKQANRARAYAEVTKDSNYLVMAYEGIGYVYSNQGLSRASINYLQTATGYIPKKEINHYKPILLNNTCAQLIRQGKFEEAIEIFEGFVNDLDPKKIPSLYLISKGNYYLCLIKIGKPEQAYESIKKDLPHIQDLNFTYGKAYQYYLLANAAEEMNLWEEALKNLEIGDPMLKGAERSKLYGFGYLLKGKYAENQGNYLEALDFFKASLQTATPTTSFGSIDESYLAIARVYNKLGKRQEANTYILKLAQVKDSVYQGWQENVVDMILLKDSLHQNTILIKQLESQKKYEKLRGRILSFVLIAIMLLAGLAIAILRNYFISKRQERIQKHNAQLKAYASELEDMAYATSHYLKEPVRGVGAYAGLLQNKLGSKLSPEESEDLSFLGRAAKRLTVLMAELSEFFKLGSKLPDFEEIDTDYSLRKIAKELIQSHEIDPNSITFEGQFPVLMAHRDLICKAFTEVMDNAVKFKGDKEFKLEIKYQEGMDSHRFIFKDYGIGLPDKYLDKVFQIFYQVDPYSDKEGVGIGLSKVRKILRIYNGTVEIQAKEGEFTQLNLILPKNQ